jgi:hypothetical protein
MRVIRGEPVEVWLRDGRPVRFVWRGRMYTVMFVLERRLLPAAEPAVAPTDLGTKDPAAEPAAAQTDLGTTDLGMTERGTTDPPTERPATGGPATVGPATTDPSDLKADGRECWRVEATPERTLPPTTYELCHDLAGDRWLLSRS